MRVRETLQILQQNLSQISPKHQGPQPNQTPQQVVLYELNRVRTALRELANVKAINPHVTTLMSEPVIQDLREHLACSPEDWNRILSKIVQIQQRGGLIIEVLQEAVTVGSPLTVSIKIPPQRDLLTLAQTITVLNKIFDRPARRLMGEGVEFDGFDTGTDWVEIRAATEGVLYLIGRIFNMASEHASSKQKLRQAEEFHQEQLSHFESMNNLDYQLKEEDLKQKRILTQHIEEVREANKRALDLKLYQQAVLTAEQVAKIENSKFEGATELQEAAMEWLNLQSKGAEAHLSLMASQFTQELFTGAKLPPALKAAPAQLPPQASSSEPPSEADKPTE